MNPDKASQARPGLLTVSPLPSAAVSLRSMLPLALLPPSCPAQAARSMTAVYLMPWLSSECLTHMTALGVDDVCYSRLPLSGVG